MLQCQVSILFAKNKDAYKGHWAGVLDSWMDGRKEHVQRSDTNDKLTDGCSENDAGTAPQDIADSNEDSAAGKTELEDLFPGHASVSAFPSSSKEESKMFVDDFGGNASDGSQAIRNGFILAADDKFDLNVGNKGEQLETVSQWPPTTNYKFDICTKGEDGTAALLERFWRLCSVHYKRNVKRVSQIAAIVPPEKRGDFYNRCIELLGEKLCFNEFCDKVNSIVSDYPNCKTWIAWYLRDNIANLLFPACKSTTEAEFNRWLHISQDTNGQEGLNNFIQILTGRQQMTLAPLCSLICEMIKTMSHEYRCALEGMPINPKSDRTTKKDKRKKREKRHDYKAGESAADLGVSMGES